MDQNKLSPAPREKGATRVGRPELSAPPDTHHDSALLTVVEQVSYQRPEAPAIVSVTRHSCRKDERLKPYEPPAVEVGPEWVRLDFGWMRSAPSALLSLRNHEGTLYKRIPTPEQVSATRARIIQVYLGVHEPLDAATFPQGEVPPGDSLRIRVRQDVEVWVRCLGAVGGMAKVTYVVFP